jgi:hypothetical protein
MFILIEFHPFLLMQFLCRCWQKAFATTADFMQILSHILHEHLSPKKAQNEHARQCPQHRFRLPASSAAVPKAGLRQRQRIKHLSIDNIANK